MQTTCPVYTFWNWSDSLCVCRPHTPAITKILNFLLFSAFLDLLINCKNKNVFSINFWTVELVRTCQGHVKYPILYPQISQRQTQDSLNFDIILFKWELNIWFSVVLLNNVSNVSIMQLDKAVLDAQSQSFTWGFTWYKHYNRNPTLPKSQYFTKNHSKIHFLQFLTSYPEIL